MRWYLIWYSRKYSGGILLERSLINWHICWIVSTKRKIVLKHSNMWRNWWKPGWLSHNSRPCGVRRQNDCLTCRTARFKLTVWDGGPNTMQALAELPYFLVLWRWDDDNWNALQCGWVLMVHTCKKPSDYYTRRAPLNLHYDFDIWVSDFVRIYDRCFPVEYTRIHRTLPWW